LAVLIRQPGNPAVGELAGRTLEDSECMFDAVHAGGEQRWKSARPTVKEKT